MTEDDTDEQDLQDRVKESVRAYASRGKQGARNLADTVSEHAGPAGQRLANTVKSRSAAGVAALKERNEDIDWKDVARTAAPYVGKALAGILVLAGFWWILQAMWSGFGPIATIAYVVLFVMGAIGVPIGVMLFAPSFPGFLKDIFGKLHWFIGALTFGNTILVETDDGWKARPARDGSVYLDGEWREITGGLEHQSTILGLPFGIAPDKSSDDAYAEYRVDPRAETVTEDTVVASTDGGNRVRGDFSEAKPDVDVSGQDGIWLVDLVRVMASGLVHAGDGELIEQAEFDKLQDEAKASRMQGWKPVVGMIAGLVLGTGTGFIIVMYM